MPCHELRVPLHLPRHRVQRVEGTLQHLTDGGAGVEATVLREVAEVGGDGDRPGIRGEQPCDAGEQRRLAGAVLADEADPVAGWHGEVDAVEHGSAVERDGQVTDDDGLDR